MPDSTAAPARIPTLDGLRGLAILLVMICHFFQKGGMDSASGLDLAVRRAAISGWIGVDLFFVLSGFLITGILLRAKGSPHYYRNFYIRRVLRIFPVYYCTLLVIFILLPAFVAGSGSLAELARSQTWYWSHLSNVFFAVNGWAGHGYVGHFWSLAVEEQFYLVWPAVVLLTSRRALVRVCLGLIASAFAVRFVLGLIGAPPEAAYVLTPARMDTLAVGALLAVAAERPNGLLDLDRWAMPVLIGCAVLLMAIFVARGGSFYPEARVVQLFGFPLITLMFAALVVRVVTRRETIGSRLLVSRPAVSLGKYSYALYVVHVPIAVLLQRYVLAAADFPVVLNSQLPGQMVFIGVAGAASLALAYLSWNLIEVHFLKLKTRFPSARLDGAGHDPRAQPSPEAVMVSGGFAARTTPV